MIPLCCSSVPLTSFFLLLPPFAGSLRSHGSELLRPIAPLLHADSTRSARSNHHAVVAPRQEPGTMCTHYAPWRYMLSTSCLASVLLLSGVTLPRALRHCASRGAQGKPVQPARSIAVTRSTRDNWFSQPFCFYFFLSGGFALSRRLQRSSKQRAIAPHLLLNAPRVARLGVSNKALYKTRTSIPLVFPRLARHNQVMSPSSAFLFARVSCTRSVPHGVLPVQL